MRHSFKKTLVFSIAFSSMIGLSGCSFMGPDIGECESDAQCHSAFGFGYQCESSDGKSLCAPAEKQPRCEVVVPDSGASLDASQTYPLATIVDDSLETHIARANAVQLAVEDANDLGGVNGRIFTLLRCTNREDSNLDSLNVDEAAAASADYVHRAWGVNVVVGPPSSASTIAVFQAIDDLTLITPSATSDALTKLEETPSDDKPGRLWRTAPTDRDQANSIVFDMKERGLSNVAVIYEDSVYGRGLAEGFRTAFDGAIAEFKFSPGVDGQRVEAQVGAAGVEALQEVLFLSSQTGDAVQFLRFASDDARFDGVSFFLSDSAANKDFLSGISAASSVFSRVRGSRPLASGAVYETFLSRYRARFAEDASQLSFTPHAFDAGWLALLATSWAVLQEGNTDVVSIGRGLRKLTSGMPVSLGSSGWQSAVDEFKAGRPIDVSGASGKLDYDLRDEELSADMEIWAINAGGDKIEVVRQVTAGEISE